MLSEELGLQDLLKGDAPALVVLGSSFHKLLKVRRSFPSWREIADI